MIKITFEVSEDFIKEGANAELTAEKMKAAQDGRAMKILFDMVGYSQLNRQIEQGKTEFIITPEKLDDKSKDLYNNEIAEICILAAFSETDKTED